MTTLPRCLRSTQVRRHTASYDAGLYARFDALLPQYGSKTRMLEWLLYYAVTYLESLPQNETITLEELITNELHSLRLCPLRNSHPSVQPERVVDPA